MTRLSRAFWSGLSGKFQCPGCGGREAFRSRPRGFFEAYVLPILFLRAVRCDRCYCRSYTLRSVPVAERMHVVGVEPDRVQPDRKQPKDQAGATSDGNSKVA